MKLLKRIMLINWHYIKCQIFDLENINFLTGKNKAGKSTIIDAIQLLMIGDTHAYYFNKAANENSKRTLKGYLRCEIADNVESGFRYLRDESYGNFASYIVAEFYDDVKNKYFISGVMFDCYTDGSHHNNFFILDIKIPNDMFMKDGTPMDSKTFKDYLYDKYRIKNPIYPSNEAFQRDALFKYGGLKKEFFNVFKKSVPFSPITEIEKFISDYICDVRHNIETNNMQESIRYYKQLEQEAESVKIRIDMLKRIDEDFNEYLKSVKRLHEHNFIIDRARQQAAIEMIDLLLEEVKENTIKLGSLQEQLSDKEDEYKQLNIQKTELLQEKFNTGYERFNDIRNDYTKKIKLLNEKSFRLYERLKRYGTTWAQGVEEVNQINLLGDQEQYINLPCNLVEKINWIRSISDSDIDSINESSLREMKNYMGDFLEKINMLHANTNISIMTLEKSIELLSKEISNLRKGINNYDPKLLELKKLIEDNLSQTHGKAIKMHILCELLDIREQKWQNAIEAYLNKQKFYLIIEPEYFIEALKLYDNFKFEKNFFDFGIIDCEKFLRLDIRRDKGSLAEVIYTDNQYARKYIDFLLGKVVRCEKVEELRQHRTSITSSCMLYHNFVARQLNPERWKYPYIGKGAIEQQIELKENERKKSTSEKERYSSILNQYLRIKNLPQMSYDEITGIIETVNEINQKEVLQKELDKVIVAIEEIGLDFIRNIDNRISSIDKLMYDVSEQTKNLSQQIGGLNTKIEQIQNEKLIEQNITLESKKAFIETNYAKEWVDTYAEFRFEKILNDKKTAEAIIDDYDSQRIRSENQATAKFQLLKKSRIAYNMEYNPPFDIEDEKNDKYNEELNWLISTKLPNYESQIKDSQNKAYEQFREDFISKLKMNIDRVSEQIDELNRYLKGISYDGDTYFFKVEPKQEYKPYYDMITDPLLMDGYSLTSEIFHSKHRNTIDELFKNIIDVGEVALSADKKAELEDNIKTYTDYRTYLRFDLKMISKNNIEESLSKTIYTKSGGETQIPFYLCVLASFVQIYRTKQRPEFSNTLRLIMFDEAFSKMDHVRIQESIRLLKKLGLQAIICAPTEKIGEIAPLVDKTILVTKIKEQSIIKEFDSKELLED